MKLKNEAARRSRVVKVEYHPDYDHDAWGKFDEGGEEPTVQSCPDAFYRVCTPAYPLHSAESTRRVPYRSLSRRALRKRLSRIGLRGLELKNTVDQILAGPADMEGRMGVIRLGWNVETFRKQFGKRITRAAFRFVSSSLVVIDEAWALLSGAGNAIKSMFRKYRSFSFSPAESSGSALPVPAGHPTIEQALKLDGKIFAMLSSEEEAVLSYYLDRGRKYGVSVVFEKDADPGAGRGANSTPKALELLKRGKSVVRVSFLGVPGSNEAAA